MALERRRDGEKLRRDQRTGSGEALAEEELDGGDGDGDEDDDDGGGGGDGEDDGGDVRRGWLAAE